MTYTFKVTLNNDTTRNYESSSYQSLYEYLYNDKKRDFEMYDIRDIQLIRKYKYTSFTRGCICLAEIDDTLYTKLANEYYLDEQSWNRHGIKSVDDYIRSVLSFNR